MKNLFALFSVKKVKVSLEDLKVEAIGPDILRKIRGGGSPIRNEEINILIAD